MLPPEPATSVAAVAVSATGLTILGISTGLQPDILLAGFAGGLWALTYQPPAPLFRRAAALVLSASATNYIEATRAGVVSKNTTAFTPGSIPLYTAVTGASTVTSYTDQRAWVQPEHITSAASVAVTGADVTLSDAQARCSYLTTTGVLTGNRNVIVPNNWQGVVFCSNTGPFTTTFKTSAGSGVVVAQTKRAILLADGTNVVRITADA